ncbi:hypothetical protein POM88_039875 [Heracleum sosnowskyi]|uniref:Uncharacterized protein n=1 Tax=Heracleum sosnowskyi TaxID=360622 RepID=A0AAD8HC04_9APIA|nr:hypothetical protein POM88_039875 [Heracleum sosnowskyi]
MGDLDVDFKVFYSKITKSSQFPESLFKLRRDVLNVKLREPVTTEHHKSLIEGMEVEEEGHKKLFVQLLNLYYIEQFALCGTKLQKPRPTSWNYVSDVDEFNKVNWASAIHELLMKSIEEAQMFLVGGRLGKTLLEGVLRSLRLSCLSGCPPSTVGVRGQLHPGSRVIIVYCLLDTSREFRMYLPNNIHPDQ